VYNLVLFQLNNNLHFKYSFHFIHIFTARSMHVRSVVLLSYRPIVCLSVTLVDCDHLQWDGLKVISRTNRIIVPLLGNLETVWKFEGWLLSNVAAN